MDVIELSTLPQVMFAAYSSSVLSVAPIAYAINLVIMSDKLMLNWVVMLDEQLRGASTAGERYNLTKINKAILDSDARVLRRLDEICADNKRFTA